jgi:CobQ-like glutamine amidotransferase family enzyme
MTSGSVEAVQIISVLPGLLGTYGDDGNVVVLQRRLTWRGIPAEVTRTTPDDPLPRLGDLYVLGGGEDWAQEVALSVLSGVSVHWLLDGPAPVLAVCAGLQILGQALPHPEGGQRPGLGLTDISTTRGGVRAIGEVSASSELIPAGLLTGFANHSGRTALGTGVRPLATVTRGPGNQGAGDRAEGVLDAALIGTYLHGPVLARNPVLADHVLTRALGHELSPLPSGPEQLLHAELIGRRHSRHSRRARQPRRP